MAKTNIYLKLDEINGESVDEDHKKWIELEFVYLGRAQSGDVREWARRAGNTVANSTRSGDQDLRQVVGHPMEKLHHRQAHSQRTHTLPEAGRRDAGRSI